MYKCLKCNKEFEYYSEYNRHKNRKTNCNYTKIQLKCDICNIKFQWPAEQKRHENTTKHIINYNISIQNNNNNNNLENEIIILNNKNVDLENKNIILNNKNDDLENEIIILNNKIIELKNKNMNFNNKIKFLENENQYLKNNNKIHNNNEYIYIIHPAQCININIYKIGRTKNIIKRFKQYPKGSELLFSITCKNSNIIESNILKFLRNDEKYINAKDYGMEYFQCNLENLKNDISKIING